MAFFDNVPYLRRFRLSDGRFFITSDQLPEPPSLLVKNFTLCDSSVDAMVLGVDVVLWLRFDTYRRSPFDATDHYPILAGFNQHNEPIYVAVAEVEHNPYFTCVEDGASTVRYADEMGYEHETNEFFVLVLRHDPSDVTPPYPRTSAGAMDPTGPLHWLKFWPEKDPDYCALSDSAKDDDDHLESLLNSCDGNTKKDLDIWWWG